MADNTNTRKFVAHVANSDWKGFTLMIDAAEEYSQVAKKNKKAFREQVLTSTSTTMADKSLSARLGEGVQILEHFGFDHKKIEQAVDAFNSERVERGGVATFSGQFLASWLVKGQIHGSDTVGKRTHGEPKADKADKAEGTEVAEGAEVAETSGDKVTAALAIFASMTADEQAFFLLAAEQVQDKQAAKVAA